MPQDANNDWLVAARELSTAEVSDALDVFRLPGSAHGIGRITGTRPLFGQAYTVRYAPVDTGAPGTVGDFLDQVPPGAIVVIDNAGRTDCTVWGGILSAMAAHRGIGGTVINGVCRDTAEAEAANYSLYARGRFMRTGKDRVQVEAVGTPVSLGDVRVCPGDYVIGDADGIVVVPQARAEAVFRKALVTRGAEEKILAAVLAGASLSEARRLHGYHTLQRAAD
ncbi:regulator of RNase E activity RraA [Cupriavidus gilardii J11]|uniref:Putative 4-hydroxy-4-methyl-2-oxoglutarate aldolase n=1 Tax=Cupriavidus gilardii J11 TaxID=936133 RepID=A0A562BFW3_9BURK|nr:RraA family protein [Cupriavidus gilardii]TWG84074.1 regulator of RNase E activity RraA [Cupriavidus gilardii J11]